ncbi:MAG TPA: amino acid permease, partial [Noviherbaspirillum sp.]
MTFRSLAGDVWLYARHVTLDEAYSGKDANLGIGRGRIPGRDVIVVTNTIRAGRGAAAPPARPARRDLAGLSPRNQAKARALGVTSATGLVIGSIIGTGVFTMPAVLASAGTVSLLVLGVIAVGAMTLAVLFGQLTRRVPSADGGLYAYARHEFGDFAGYLTGWCYWIQAWAGNAAIVSAWVFYVDALFGINPSGMGNWGI